MENIISSEKCLRSCCLIGSFALINQQLTAYAAAADFVIQAGCCINQRFLLLVVTSGGSLKTHAVLKKTSEMFSGRVVTSYVTLLVVTSVVLPFWTYKNKGTVKTNSISTKLNFGFENLQKFAASYTSQQVKIKLTIIINILCLTVPLYVTHWLLPKQIVIKFDWVLIIILIMTLFFSVYVQHIMKIGKIYNGSQFC